MEPGSLQILRNTGSHDCSRFRNEPFLCDHAYKQTLEQIHSRLNRL